MSGMVDFVYHYYLFEKDKDEATKITKSTSKKS